MFIRSRALVLIFVALASPGRAAEDAASLRLLEARRIWDAAPHNAFTDLTRFSNRWFCVFREGATHVSPDGALRVITSVDGREWQSAARLTLTNGDLRDAKIVVTPAGELMLNGAVAWPRTSAVKHQSLAWFSRDGREWSSSAEIGETNFWLWRATWHRDAAYGVGYATAGAKLARLYRSTDGRRFETLVPRLFGTGYPNEASLLFLPDETALCLLRRDGEPASGQLGTSRPPYREWRWQDLGVKIGGPQWLRLPDGRIIVTARLYDGSPRTSLLWLDAARGKLTEALKLPSGGDTSYAGLVWHAGELWVSYYSSHEGGAKIYLARVAVPGL